MPKFTQLIMNQVITEFETNPHPDFNAVIDRNAQRFSHDLTQPAQTQFKNLVIESLHFNPTQTKLLAQCFQHRGTIDELRHLADFNQYQTTITGQEFSAFMDLTHFIQQLRALEHQYQTSPAA